MNKLTSGLSALLVLILIIFLTAIRCDPASKSHNQKGTIIITVDKKRPDPGDTVFITVTMNSARDPGRTEVFLVKPTKGSEKLEITKDHSNNSNLNCRVIIDNNFPEGFYVITAVNNNGREQTAGKASFLLGKVVLDYAITSNFNDSGTAADMENYLDRFVNEGGNALTLHANIAAEKMWGGTSRVRAVWASKVCKNAVASDADRIEMMLNLTDKIGIPSFISVSWDLTDSTLHNPGYLKSIQEITDELWSMFGHHPSLTGFYSYQEGSGTYFASYIREFCRIVKRNNQGLLTMCAPNIDDPLLAGYLAAIDDLDIINYQAPIMTSYRPDNRKLFPNRRVKDVTSLSAGATRVSDKITLSHLEFMGYIENKVAGAYLTGYNNIFNQFLSVASAYGTDGITFFSYYSCIYFNSGKLPEETKIAAKAVADGLKAYRMISKEIADKPSHLALYVPYNDWCIERWTICFLPATDALCRLGVSPEIIPFIPKKGEEILPFYPMNKNEEQLKYLTDNRYVLILPDISGMQETDSEMLEAFVRDGGVVIAFGPRIPYGDRFNRSDFWGGKEISPIQNNSVFNRIKIKRSLGPRSKPNELIGFAPAVSTSWNPAAEQRIADFPDGSCAVFSNPYHKGKTYVITLSLKESANGFPDLLRDIFDDALGNYGIKRQFDVYGVIDNMDVTMNEDKGKFSIMIANYNETSVEIRVKPLIREWSKNYDLVELKSGVANIPNISVGSDIFKVKVDLNNYVAVSLVLKDSLK